MTPQDILFRKKVSGKSHLLRIIAERISDITNINSQVIYERIINEEKQGSFSMGQGLIVPRVELPMIKEPFCLLMTLDKLIDYNQDSQDKVDLVCVFIMPENKGVTNLRDLSMLIRSLQNTQYLDLIRGATSKDAIYSIMRARSDDLPQNLAA